MRSPFYFLLLISSYVLLLPVCAFSGIHSIETKVLRVFAIKKSGYYHKPWKTPDFSDVRASGFFFKDEKNFPGVRGLILTNAHAVSQSQSIKVSNGREKRRYHVTLVGVCDSADFAVLKMEEEELELYEQRNGKTKPLKLGDSDKLRVGDKVLGWGYPLGGQRISKSEEGEISRIEVSKYAYSKERWLMVQASLQQNRGNSGGPVLRRNKVVGVAFQGMISSDRINFFIPINLIRSLFPALRDHQKITKWRFVVQHIFPRLKDYYGLDPDSGGVLLDYIIPDGGPYNFGLRKDDIILEIDDHEIDNFGDIYFKPLAQKVYFGEILNRKKKGDPLKIKIMRQGEEMIIEGPLTKGLPKLTPRIFTTANYFILGGIGFVELTHNCITNLGKSGRKFRYKYLSEFPERPYEKIVIISEVFPDYGIVSPSSYLKRVVEINNEPIVNLEHLYNITRDLKEKGRKWALLKLTNNVQLPIDLENAPELDKLIQEKYGILYMKTPEGFHQ
jgi:S1-C subfamily serine protease